MHLIIGMTLDFMFVNFNFNVPQTRITDLVGNVSDEKID